MERRNGIPDGMMAISMRRWWFCATGAVRPPPDGRYLEVWLWPRFTLRWIAAFFVAKRESVFAGHTEASRAPHLVFQIMDYLMR